MNARMQVRAQVISCSSCELVERCTAPVAFDGPTPTSLAVVGEAPGRHEDAAGKPFVGPSGEYLRAAMATAGLPVGETMFMNAVSCYPVDYKGNGRSPNATEIRACKPNLEAQMELANATYFLLTGRVPLNAVRPGLKISQARGRPFFLDGTLERLGTKVCVPVYHPSYVLRMGGEGTKADDSVQADLALLRTLMDAGPEGWMQHFLDTCVTCDQDAIRYEDDGIAWCEEHWPDGEL